MTTGTTHPSRDNVGAATGAICLAGMLWVASGFSSGYANVALTALSVSSMLYGLVRGTGIKTPVDPVVHGSAKKLLDKSPTIVSKAAETVVDGAEKVVDTVANLFRAPPPPPPPSATTPVSASAAIYAGGMAMVVDAEEQVKYQELFTCVEKSLRDCGLIDQRPVYLTFHFSTGKGFYRLADGTGVVHEFDILHPNILDPEYAKLSPAEQKQKAAELEQAIANLQSHCKKMVVGIGKRTMAEEIAGELQKEGKRKPDGKEFTSADIVVDIDKGTYSIKGGADKDPIPLSDGKVGRLREIRGIIEEQEQCIDKFASPEDPEAERHLMGRVGNVRNAAQSCLNSTKRRNTYLPPSTLTADVGGVSQSVVQQDADETLRDSEQELKELRAGYRIDVLEGVHLLVADVEHIMVHILDQIIEEKRTQLESSADVASQESKILMEKFDDKFAAAVEELVEDLDPSVQDAERKKLGQYKEYFKKDVDSYVQEINANVNSKTTVLQSANATLKQIRTGIKHSEVLEKIFDVTVKESSNVICGIIDATLEAEPGDSISWKEKMLHAEARRRASIDQKNDPDLLDPKAAQAHMEAVKRLEVPQILGYVGRIHSEISKGSKSVRECVREEIKKIQEIQSNSKMLRDSQRQEARKDIERRIEECIAEQDRLQQRINSGRLSSREKASEQRQLLEKQNWLKKALDSQVIADVFLDNPMNDWVCRNYRHRIIVGQHSSSWNVFGKFSSTEMEVASKDVQMEELKCCFQDAKTSLLGSAFLDVLSTPFRAGPLPSKKEKIQAILNSFTLLVPEGCESDFEQFVLEQGKIDQTCYTLPHGWKELRIMARDRAKERSSKSPSTTEDDVANIDKTLTASLQTAFGPVQSSSLEEPASLTGNKIDPARDARIARRRQFGPKRLATPNVTT